MIGKEARAQMLSRIDRLPDLLVAAMGGGSNAIGLFHPFLDDAEVAMLGVEAAGHGLDKQHAASLAGGSPGVLHGNKTYLLQDEDGQIAEAHSISAGLDYPGIGPEHCMAPLDRPRANTPGRPIPRRSMPSSCSAGTEGIIPALELSHAIAAATSRRARDGSRTREQILCGPVRPHCHGDIFIVAEALGVEIRTSRTC